LGVGMGGMWAGGKACSANSTNDSKMQKIIDEKNGWWAMSAYAFEMEPVGGKVGWTVLRLAKGVEGEEEGEGGGYVLWEVER